MWRSPPTHLWKAGLAPLCQEKGTPQEQRMGRGPEPLLVQTPVGALWGDWSHRSQEHPVLWAMLPTVAWGDGGHLCQACAKLISGLLLTSVPQGSSSVHFPVGPDSWQAGSSPPDKQLPQKALAGAHTRCSPVPRPRCADVWQSQGPQSSGLSSALAPGLAPRACQGTSSVSICPGLGHASESQPLVPCWGQGAPGTYVTNLPTEAPLSQERLEGPSL